MSLFWVLFCAKCLCTNCIFMSFCYKPCTHPMFSPLWHCYFNFCLKHFGHWLCSFPFILVCTCHIFVHKSFWHFILTNCRLWYEGTPKYLGESVTGSEIGIQNWWVGSCVATGTVRFIQQGCWQMHGWVGMTLLHIHKVYPTGTGKQMIMMSFHDVTVITLM